MTNTLCPLNSLCTFMLYCLFTYCSLDSEWCSFDFPLPSTKFSSPNWELLGYRLWLILPLGISFSVSLGCSLVDRMLAYDGRSPGFEPQQSSISSVWCHKCIVHQDIEGRVRSSESFLGTYTFLNIFFFHILWNNDFPYEEITNRKCDISQAL